MPTFDAHQNFAYSTVATAPSPATSGQSLVVQAGDGAKFPSPPFNVAIWPANSQPTTANAEVARVTAKSTDTFTIARSQEGSTAQSIAVGYQIANTVTAKFFTDIETQVTLNPKPYISLPAGWDARWKTVKAAQAGTVMIVGDSISQGTALNSDIINKRLGRLLLNWLNTSVGGAKVAEHFPSADNAVSPWSATGSNEWALGTASGLGYENNNFIKGITATGTTGTLMVFTTPFACTDADLVFRDVATGTLNYQVDGGAVQNFSTTGDGTQKRIQLTGLANTTHTFTFGPQSVATQISITGVTLYYGSRSATGWTLANHVCSGQNNANLYNVTGVAQAYKSSQATLGPIAAPDLLIFALGVNDSNASIPPQPIQQGATWILEAARISRPAMSVLVLAMGNFDPNLSDVGVAFGAGYGPSWYQGIAALKSLANANGYGFINIHNRWSPNPVGQGFVNSGSGNGQPHPNDTGHADMATAIESVL